MTPGGASASEETLRDGRVVVLRPLRGDDAAGVEVLWRRLDAVGRRRFLELAHLPPGHPHPGDVAAPRPGHTAGIVATAQAGSLARVVGVARYERTAGDAAGFSVFVDAPYRRAGLGTMLLRRLTGAARHAGVRRLVTDVPKSDAAVLRLVSELGLDYEEQAAAAASVHASFAVQETDAYLDAVLADQRAAAQVALGPFLRPRSIAVVGASGKRASIGGLLLAHLLGSGFTGALYPLNPRHQSSRGYPPTRICLRALSRRISCSWLCRRRWWPGSSTRRGLGFGRCA